MFDKELALSLLLQLEEWLVKIRQRSEKIETADSFINSTQGEEKFDSSGAISANMFEETWRRFVIKMATGSGKTKVMSLILA